MISFHVRADDAPLTWRRTASGLARGSSRIDPFRHAALDELVAVDGDRLLVCVREKDGGSAGQGCEPAAPALLPSIDADGFDRLVSQCRDWPLQWHLLIVDGASVRIEAGLWGTAPIFLVASVADEAAPAWLNGDWDADRLLPGLRRASLDPGRAALWIAEYDLPYARQTAFAGLKLLTERGVALWAPAPDGGQHLDISYPEPCPRPVAGTLREDADPVAAWERILRASMRRWTRGAGDTLGVELSGGLDSALVAAIAASDAERPLPSYGLAITGAVDAVADQHARRADLVATLGINDSEIPMREFLPLGPGSKRVEGTASVLPWDEGYYEAMDRLLECAYANGTRVMLTGFGGDELSMLRAVERQALGLAPMDDEPLSPPGGPAFLTAAASAKLAEPVDLPPRAAMSGSSVAVAALSAARYLRHGIWPVHPLCTPELVHFCARLPAPLRAGRTTQRALLTRLGVSSIVTDPAYGDDLSPALVRSMRFAARPLLDRLFAAPLLAELGVVDPDRLRSDYAEWCDSDSSEGAEPFYATAILELCLARMA